MQDQLALVCVGGGRGARFGGDKLSEQLGGRTVFALALQALQRAFPQAPMIAVCPATQLERWHDELVPAYPELSIVAGGELRQHSVEHGVTAARDRFGAELVAVHDAARPLVDPGDVVRVVSALGEHAGALLCHRVADTVKRVDRQGRVLATVARDDLRLSLTPQVFRVSTLVRAWQSVAPDQVWTDEAALLEAAGLSIQTVEACHPNPKITTSHDLVLVRALLGATR